MEKVATGLLVLVGIIHPLAVSGVLGVERLASLTLCVHGQGSRLNGMQPDQRFQPRLCDARSRRNPDARRSINLARSNVT